MAVPKRTRGKLKIFLGYSAGVGKTYAMVEAAFHRKTQGAAVVVAWINSRGQADTDALLEKLEIVPPCLTCGGEEPLYEMDLDAVLRRKPQLALVDELAHANAAGGRHSKRWQDVEELLNAGIDVYTTCEVRQLGSLVDKVREITGLVMDETVPDLLLDQAAEFEVVDLPPEELLQRIQAGKVDLHAESPEAVEPFLHKGTLTALRELTLRRAAETVEDQRLVLESAGSKRALAERVAVCVSSHPMGPQLVRAGRRLADDFNAEWFVVYVETPAHLLMGSEQRGRLLQTLHVAEELGAKVETLTGERVANTLIEFARREQVTRIVVGKPLRPRWVDALRGSLLERIVRLSGDIDVFVVSGAAEGVPDWQTQDLQALPGIWNYMGAALAVALAVVLGLLAQPLAQSAVLMAPFLAAVVVTALFLGRWPAILAAVGSALAFAFFFSGERMGFGMVDFQHVLTLLGLVAVGLVISRMERLLREQVRAAREREMQSDALNDLSRDLTVALELEEMLEVLLRHVHHTFGGEVAIFLPVGGAPAVMIATPGFNPGENGPLIAKWVYEHGQAAGRGTKTLADAPLCYLPLETNNGTVGVLAVAPSETGEYLSPDQRELLDGFASLAALGIERVELNEQARQAAVLQTAEKLQTALLNSISHDLRTPLATISGAISTLQEAEDNEVMLDKEARLDLLENAGEQSERLNQIVGNLLNMTRLEAGSMRVKNVEVDAQDLIGTALRQNSRKLVGREVSTMIPQGLPSLWVDYVLILQVLNNVIDNAIKYSPPGTPLEVSAEAGEKFLTVRVSDRGLGIPAEDRERVFGKFYRVQRNDGVSGTGLGLSICRGIVEAHEGQIWAEERPGGGTTMVIDLPVMKE
ncbi:MAG: sensor histidine kinase KdpD [Anaerolineaceae bacterium]|nr:sensor histidine kinase KdpD [Anaerolineaceae bacterium]